MTEILLIVLLAAAWIAGRAGWRRLRLAGIVLAWLAVLAIGCGPVPAWLLQHWEAPYAHRPDAQWAASNAIVLLTASANNPPGGRPEPGQGGYTRIAETVALYRSCREAGTRCTVLVSGGDASMLGEPLAQVYRHVLVRLGVPEADIVLEPRSRTTWQNAEFARAPLARIGAEKVWLVSSALHLRRAEFAFRHFGIPVTPMRADYPRGVWTWIPDAYNFQVTDLALHECGGLLLYRWQAWRQGVPAPEAGSAAAGG